MSYRIAYWSAISDEQRVTDRETRPGCSGNFTKPETGCGRRPDHVVVYVSNPSGLPGAGVELVRFACYRHLHTLLDHAETVGSRVVVSKHLGV